MTPGYWNLWTAWIGITIACLLFAVLYIYTDPRAIPSLGGFYFGALFGSWSMWVDWRSGITLPDELP